MIAKRLLQVTAWTILFFGFGVGVIHLVDTGAGVMPLLGCWLRPLVSVGSTGCGGSMQFITASSGCMDSMA